MGGACSASPRVQPAPPTAPPPPAPPPPASQALCDDIEFLASRCVVCLHAPLEIMLQPCGHFCLCAACAVQLRRPQCPMCRGPILDRHRVFMPSTRRSVRPQNDDAGLLAQTV
jgi:protein neuralized